MTSAEFQNVRAKRPIALGVIGLGRAFSLMLPTFLGDPRVKLVAACDPRATARSRFERDFGAPAYDDVAALVENESIEAVYIASPHQFHAEHTCMAAAHGKHVLLEKPMALTLGECDEMIAACRRTGVYLIVGHCHSFDTPYRRARSLIETGELGRVSHILAVNYTDFLYRPRRPEELRTELGGGVVFSQAAHQVDVVRLIAGSRVSRVRAATGVCDPDRPAEGAYSALLWFDDGVFASLSYSGYAHFDSDEWCGWIGEMGNRKSADDYGAVRRRLQTIASSAEEAQLKNAGTYGGPSYMPAAPDGNLLHQHFGPVVVSCERGDVRPMPDALWIYGHERRECLPLDRPDVPRFEVVDELYAAIVHGERPLHDGRWAKATLEVCLALLQSSREGCDVQLEHQVGLRD